MKMKNISIEFCVVWNYEPRAVSLAAEIKENFEIESKMIPSGGGVFEVVVDGELVFSKKELKRHAEEGEVLGILKRYSSN